MVHAGDVQRLEIGGSDPLIDTGLQSWLLSIDTDRASEIHLHLTTDCTDWDDGWSVVMSRFATCTVSVMVQNLNIGRLGQVMNWCRDRELRFTPVLIADPDCLHITNLPYPALGWATNNVLGWKSQTSEPHLREFLDQCFTLLIQTQFDEDRWQKFLAHAELRDRVRGTDWRQWIPTG
jgi:hypothetical protein